MSKPKFTTDQKIWIGASLAGIAGITFYCLKPKEGYLAKWQRQQLEEKLMSFEPEDLIVPESTTEAVDNSAGMSTNTEGEPFKQLVDAVKDALGFEDDEDVEAA